MAFALAAALLVLAAAAVAFLQYGGAGTSLTGAWIAAPPVPEWQQVLRHAFAQVAQQLVLAISAADSHQDATYLNGARGIGTFETNGKIYAAVAGTSADAVQIIEITDPDSIAAADMYTNTDIDAVEGIETFEIDGRPYAAVAAYGADAVQILNLTDPASITRTGGITDTSSLLLDGPRNLDVYEAGGRTYAAVGSWDEDGIQIIDVTDPASVTAKGSIAKDTGILLDGVADVAVFKIDGHTYAVATAYIGKNIQVLNITDPDSITATDNLSDGGALELSQPWGLAIFEPGDGNTYAAVAGFGDNGVQIIDVTDPTDIAATDRLRNGAGILLNGPRGLAQFAVGDSTYLAVAAAASDAVQIIDVTDPAGIAAAGYINGTGVLLDNAWGVDTFTADGIPYAAVAATGSDAVQIIKLANSTSTTPADSTPPTFVSSRLDGATGVLTITFSEEIDATPATNVVPAKIHIRESGSYTGGTTLAAGELDTTADGATISFTLTAQHLTEVAGLATPELTIDPGAVRDTSDSLIVGTFDVSTAVFVDDTSVSSEEASPQGMAFSNDGAKMFVIGSDGDDVNEYALSTAFDASTAVFVDATSVRSEERIPTGMAFSNDGAKMFVIGSAGDDVNEYALSTAFDASTATFVDAFSVSSEETNPQGMAFSSDGTRMFVIGNTGDDVNEYALSAAFDASTATFVDAFSVSSQETAPQGMAFSSDGAKMFVIGNAGDGVNEYALSTAFDASTAVFVDAFSVSSQDSIPSGMAFSSDGAKMFVVGNARRRQDKRVRAELRLSHYGEPTRLRYL